MTPYVNKYALLVSGGVDRVHNYSRYLNDLVWLYNTLLSVGFEKSKIIVLYADGASHDLDGDGNNEIHAAATQASLASAFTTLQAQVTGNDLFLFFSTNHGGLAEPGSEDGKLWLWGGDSVVDSDFATYVNAITSLLSVVVMEQCNSGGFIDALAGSNRVIMTACQWDQSSYGCDTEGNYDEFSYHWTAAVAGQTPDGTPVGGGLISLKDTFDYALAHDSRAETPQYYENPTGLGSDYNLGTPTGVPRLPAQPPAAPAGIPPIGTLPVFTLEPNWSSPVKLTQNHNTIVREALDLSEERIIGWPHCLYDLSYKAEGSASMTGAQTAWTRKTIELAQNLPILMPVWPQRIQLTADAHIADVTLQVEDPTSFFFAWRPYAILMDRWDNYEVIQITAISDDGRSLILSQPITKNWVASDDWISGPRLYPLLIGQLKREGFKQLTDEVGTLEVDFKERVFYGPDLIDELEPPGPVDEPELDVPTCADTVTLSWAPNPAAAWYQVWATDDIDNPLGWYKVIDWILFDEFTEIYHGSVTVYNDSLKERHWKVVTVLMVPDGSTGSDTSTQFVGTSPPPVVSPCVIQISAPTVTRCPHTGIPPLQAGECQRKVVFPSVSHSWFRKFECLMANDETFVVLRSRYDYLVINDFEPTQIQVMCPTDGAVVRWRTDGLDPQLGDDSEWHQGLPEQDWFGCIVKARAWKDGCPGPLCCVTVDKRWNMKSEISITGSSFTGASACQETIYQCSYDGVTHECVVGAVETGLSCLLWHPLGLCDDIRDFACGHPSPAADSEQRISWFRTDYRHAGEYPPDPLPTPADCGGPPACAGEFGGGWESCAATGFLASLATWQRDNYFWKRQLILLFTVVFPGADNDNDIWDWNHSAQGDTDHPVALPCACGGFSGSLTERCQRNLAESLSNQLLGVGYCPKLQDRSWKFAWMYQTCWWEDMGAMAAVLEGLFLPKRLNPRGA